MRKASNFLNGFGQGMKNFGEDINTLINFVILSVIYIMGIGATSIISKIFKKKFLEKGPSEETDTYWSDLKFDKKGTENHYRQY